MSSAGCKFKIAALTCLVAVGLASVASAHVTYGGTCIGCHSKTPAGDLTWSPTAITVSPGGNGSISFNLASWGISSTGTTLKAGISVQDIDNALLNATIVAGTAGWAYNNETHGKSYVTGALTALGMYVLDFSVGAGATPGDYPIGVSLATSGAGGSALRGGFNTPAAFTITVIPEPATLSLLFAGVSAVFFRRPKR